MNKRSGKWRAASLAIRATSTFPHGLDHVFIERLWRSLKYEDIYLRDYENGTTLIRGVGKWLGHYNDCRPHQALGYCTPGEVYRSPESYGDKPAAWTQILNPDRFRW